MPPPPHLQPGRNLYNQRGASAKANSAGTVSFDKIKCGICGVTKPVAEYAKRQQQKHADSIYNPYAPGGRSIKAYATCKTCTAKQVTKLHCMVCNNTMDVKYFNKTQRHTPDHARCKKCVQVNEDRGRADPTLVDSDDYSDDSSGSEGEIDYEGGKDESNLPRMAKMPSPQSVTNDDSESQSEIDASDSEQKTSIAKKNAPPARSKKASMASTPIASTPSVRAPGKATPTWAKAASAAASTPPTGTATPTSYSSILGTPDTPLSGNSGSNDGEWQTVSSGRAARKGNAFSSSRGSAWNSGLHTPALTSVKKGGWAKPEKLKKDQNPPFFQTPPGAEPPLGPPAYLPTGGQPSMVNKKSKSAQRENLMKADSDDEYQA